jgi:ADP-heptose:LPS heptosyltransferase
MSTRKILIIKLGATGDVVRTTPLITALSSDVTWITADKNEVLFSGVNESVRCISWSNREQARDRNYDLVVNLEDTIDVASFVQTVSCVEVRGAYLDSQSQLTYTDELRDWFDLSIISIYGRERADALKFRNRRTYQDLVFKGVGLRFAGEPYLLPGPIDTDLAGDVAIAAEAGPVWPMKRWAYYDQLKQRLETDGLTVNVLPKRSSLLKHLADVRNHRCLVGGDSLPMHFALGTGTRCVTIFTCTSPWEIYDYGVQKKIVSPLLEEFFYKRGYNERATTAISVDEVFDAVIAQFEAPIPVTTPSSAT